MGRGLWLILIMLIVGGGEGNLAYATNPHDEHEKVIKGKAIYKRVCQLCHGSHGEGDGPAAFFGSAYSAPRPRDFTIGEFKFRTTLSGELPTDQDLFRTITLGVPGYMPLFEGLTEEERWQVIAYLKTFTVAFEEEAPVVMTSESNPPPPTPENIEHGRQLYRQFECGKCHGLAGRGNGQLSLDGELQNDLGLLIRPTDLTNLSSFKNGATARDIVRTLLTGMNGTPMPSYADTVAGHEEDLWYVAYYVLSLSSQRR